MKKSVCTLAITMLALVLAGCATHSPGNSTHNWLNGTWSGPGHAPGWEYIYRLKVIDDHKIVGWQETSDGYERGEGEVIGEFTDPKTFWVKAYRRDRFYIYTFRRVEEGKVRLVGGDNLLTKLP